MDVHFQFFSVPEAAEILGCTDGRVRQLLINGEIHGHKLGSRLWAIPFVEIDRYRRVKHTTGRPRKSTPNHNL